VSGLRPASLLPAVAGSVAVLLVVAAAVLALTDDRGDVMPPAGAGAGGSAQRFLDLYMAADGRVVRRDQGGDTVSEGQAYAMLLAVAAHDRDRFETAWRWTRENLQRDDGLLAHRWQEGRIVDADPAADADLDAAHALVLAGRRFDAPDLRREGLEIAAAILTEETIESAEGRVLVAGPWARTGRPWINASYFSPRAFALLGRVSRDPRWRELRRSSRRLTDALTAHTPGLPPDWARLAPAGWAVPAAAPGGRASAPRFGYDAVRVPLRWAAACARTERRLAARPWPFLHGQAGGGIAAAYGLDGRRLAPGTHPAALVAGAAAAFSAGDRGAGGRLLDRAAAEERRVSTYYGAALVALGRVLLQSSRLEGGC
jgi:endo-1,4-beta-D-glucanase Y